jgi:hypothetical protein
VAEQVLHGQVQFLDSESACELAAHTSCHNFRTLWSGNWLINEVQPLTADALAEIERETPGMVEGVTRGRAKAPRLAVELREVVCYNVHKLFGAAEVRLDAVIVHGGSAKSDADSFYQPQTMRFADVHNGQALPIDAEHGLLLFNGSPLHFLDIFIMASRDRGDTDELSSLLRKELSSDAGKEATSALLALAVAAPTAAMVAGAVAAASVIGDLAYRVVRAVSPKSIGMYRGSFLQFRDAFGVGRHPSAEVVPVSVEVEVAVPA